MKKDIYHGSAKIVVRPAESRLKRLRTAARLSQSELAERTGLNVRTLQHYEQGTKDIRRAAGETLQILARALGTTIENILG